MIDNIGRFVNEHRTLMVVIISVLVMCFLYWWLCCKVSATKGKFRGGTELVSHHYLSSSKILFDCLGLNIIGLFFVLNETGRREVENKNECFKMYVTHINHFINYNFEGDYLSLPNLVKNPYRFFVKDETSGKAMINLIPNERKSNKNPNPMKCGDYIDAANSFDFESCLEYSGEDIKKAILDSYDELIEFVSKYYHIYVDKVTYIGQPSTCTFQQ